MKRKMFLIVLMALTLFGFIGCSHDSDDDDDDSGSEVSYLAHDAFADYKEKKVSAMYEWVNTGLGSYTMKKAYIFFEDNTYVLSDIEGHSELKVDPESKGTYTGDATKDGVIKVKGAYRWGQDYSTTDTTKKWMEWSNSESSITIEGGKFRSGVGVYTKK